LFNRMICYQKRVHDSYFAVPGALHPPVLNMLIFRYNYLPGFI
jgi:hypothetical protein